MLTTSRKQLVEKIIERDGMLFRVVFALSKEYGQVQAQIIKVIPLGKIEEASEIIALPEAKKAHVYGETLEKVFVEAILSPYTNSLFFSGSKPRAPTLS